MAAHTSPNAGMPTHHIPPPSAHQANGYPAPSAQNLQIALKQLNEGAWVQLGNLAELQNDTDGALQAYERALSHNQYSVPALLAMSSILRSKDRFDMAVEYLRTILKVETNNGDVWGSLGHCYLMLDNLQEAYSAYQQALYHLQDPKEPKLWYGIGILYDRYGSLEHAEEAFSQVMRMAPDFEKANEIYFRLGIIYKQQSKYAQSLECFKYIVSDPPRPLTEEDIWFQIGHVHEQQKDFDSAKAAYKRVLDHDPNHAKVLQQLGWLHHQQNSSYQSQEQAIEYLEKSVAADQTDAQSWYLLGRCYMSQQKYPKAYEAYQQAVYRDGRNPTFWCSIGVLYYQINQYRDALDAYSRAIRLNPNISEVWYDLGTLYESCNNQTNDALDAYQRAAELDPSNQHIKARLQLLQSGQAQPGMPNQNNAPLPQDVHPQAYQPAPLNGPPGPQWGGPQLAQPSHAQPPPSLDYGRRLAEIQQHPQPPPQHLQQVHAPPYDNRDAGRHQGPPQLPAAPRAPSPRPDPIRHHHEPSRPNATPRRGMSPSPKTSNAMPHPYQQGPGGILPPPPPPQHQHVQQTPPQPPALGPPQRISNPNYAPPSGHGPPMPMGHPGPSDPYSRPRTPPPEIKPIVENRPSSAASNYQQQPGQGYLHHANTSAPANISMGAPPPSSAAEAAARDRDNRTPVPTKRHREWEDDHMREARHPPDEKRQRLDDHVPRPPSRVAGSEKPSPSTRRSIDRDMRRPYEPEHQRRMDMPRMSEPYHPSEAAHHPALPAMQHGPPPPPAPPQSAPPVHHQQHQPPPLNQGPHPPSHQQTPIQAPQQLPRMSEPPPHIQPPAPPAIPQLQPREQQTPVPTPQPQPQPLKESKEEPRLEVRPFEPPQPPRREMQEPAARKMEVDENYDDDDGDVPPPPASVNAATVSGAEMKRPMSAKTERESPRSTNGVAVGNE